jgi:spore coat polysaccharide biosynthesis predicted glycosyltransferase SpsG
LQNTKRILVAPLDWGLGHTSRCVPIIKELQAQHAQVVVTCNAQQKNYLEQEVQDVEYILQENEPMIYAKTKLGTALILLLQIPKLLMNIIREHAWLQIIAQTRRIDGVISDNRYGLYTKKAPSILITHQLQIQVPIGKSIMHRMNQYFIKQFRQCWVPDFDGENSLSGILSNADGYENVKKIGILSRFAKENHLVNHTQKPYSILCILSGPEPQKTMLMQMMVSQINETNYSLTIVGDANAEARISSEKINYISIADTNTLHQLILSHQYIITRSGYSSMMDLHKLGRHAIIIPTPGQTEQEYLAEYLMVKKWHYALTQNKFDLQNSINEFDKMHFEKFHIENQNKLAISVSEFLESC